MIFARYSRGLFLSECGERFVRLLFLLAGFFVVLWLAGFFVFYQQVSNQYPSPETFFKRAVVFTGGVGRIEAGLFLLRESKVKHLFISGVKKNAIGRFASGVGKANQPVLGFFALNTYGNVQEVLGWLRRERASTLVLVTSDYHMPRSLLLLSKFGKSVRVQQYPVRTPPMKRFYKSLSEYHKYIWTFLAVHVRVFFNDQNATLAFI